MNNCCRCGPAAITPSCRVAITSADLADLLYIQGLDDNLCVKFQAVADLLQLTDCEGNLIDFDTPIVTCAAFQQILCDTLAVLASGGSLELGVTEIVGADCQVYTVPETLLTVVDTSCINLTVSGDFNHTLQADLVIAPTEGNAAECTEGGLYVPDLCTELDGVVFGGEATPGETELLGTDCFSYTVPAQQLLLVEDTDTVDLTINGTLPQTLSADVRIDPDSDIDVTSDGLYLEIIAVDTPCLDMTVTSVNGLVTVSGAPVISPNGGNALSCAGNGLYVPTPAETDVSIVGIDTPCFDITVSEGPANSFTIQGAVVVSPNAGNAISCAGNGLYAPEASATAIVGIDNDCANTDVTFNEGLDQWEVEVTPIIDPDDCNSLVCNPAGLFVPEQTKIQFGGVASGILLPPPGTSISADQEILSQLFCFTITNPSDCFPAIVNLIVNFPNISFVPDTPPGFLTTNLYASSGTAGIFSLPTSFTVGVDIPAIFGRMEGNTSGELVGLHTTSRSYSGLLAPGQSTEICIQFQAINDGTNIIDNVEIGNISSSYTLVTGNN